MAQEQLVYIGSWQIPPKGESGIRLCSFHPKSGALKILKHFSPEVNVGALRIKDNRLYATDERKDSSTRDSGGGGNIYTFSIAADGMLQQLGSCPSMGVYPSDVQITVDKKYALVTNLAAGSPITKTRKGTDGKYRVVTERDEANLTLFELDQNGVPTEVIDILRFRGSGPNPRWQTCAHPHSVRLSPDGTLILVCDRGSDLIWSGVIENGTLQKRSTYKTPAGEGPRYAVFHPILPTVYLTNELTPTLTAYSYGSTSGVLTRIAAVNMLPDGYVSKAGQAVGWSEINPSDIVIDRFGRYLYAGLRGENLIAVFSVEAEGEPALRAVVPCGGINPRALSLSPDGRWLLCANLDSSDVAIFAVDRGTLTRTGSLSIPGPGAIAFL